MCNLILLNNQILDKLNIKCLRMSSFIVSVFRVCMVWILHSTKMTVVFLDEGSKTLRVEHGFSRYHANVFNFTIQNDFTKNQGLGFYLPQQQENLADQSLKYIQEVK